MRDGFQRSIEILGIGFRFCVSRIVDDATESRWKLANFRRIHNEYIPTLRLDGFPS